MAFIPAFILNINNVSAIDFTSASKLPFCVHVHQPLTDNLKHFNFGSNVIDGNRTQKLVITLSSCSIAKRYTFERQI